MGGLLPADERVEALEHRVDVTGVGGEVEDGGEVGAAPAIAASARDEVAEVRSSSHARMACACTSR